MKEIILIGYFPEAAELCERAGYTIVGIVDKIEPIGCPYDYLGNDQSFLSKKEGKEVIPLLLVPDAPKVRKHLYEEYRKNGFQFETVISPRAFISPTAVISEGCMIQDGCNISSNVKLGKCVRVNSLANVMHDVSVGDFATIAPSGVVLGQCIVGQLTYIGANATILPKVEIRSEAVVGAGAVVTKEVNSNTVVAGVPAKNIIKLH